MQLDKEIFFQGKQWIIFDLKNNLEKVIIRKFMFHLHASDKFISQLSNRSKQMFYVNLSKSRIKIFM